MPWSTAQLSRRAGGAGTQIGALCDAGFHQQGEPGIRRILGVLSLTQKNGTAAVEDACAAALEIGVRPQLTLRQADPLMRELTEYYDFINLKTEEQPALFIRAPERL